MDSSSEKQRGSAAYKGDAFTSLNIIVCAALFSLLCVILFIIFPRENFLIKPESANNILLTMPFDQFDWRVKYAYLSIIILSPVVLFFSKSISKKIATYFRPPSVFLINATLVAGIGVIFIDGYWRPFLWKAAQMPATWA